MKIEESAAPHRRIAVPSAGRPALLDGFNTAPPAELMRKKSRLRRKK
jgi:hypothetical protein